MADQDYQYAADILKSAIEQMFADGVPKEELPPLLADFAAMFAFGIGKSTGTLAILVRMSEYAAQLEVEQSPDPSAQDARNAAFLLQSLREEPAEGQGSRFSLIRHAMENMTQLQGMSLEEACGCMVYYALGLLIRERGIGAGEALVQCAQDELARFNKDRT